MQAAVEDIRLLPDHEGRDDFPEAAFNRNTARKRGWNVIDILGGSPEKFMGTLGYPGEALDAYEAYLKVEWVDVEELDLVEKRDKASKRS